MKEILFLSYTCLSAITLRRGIQLVLRVHFRDNVTCRDIHLDLRVHFRDNVTCRDIHLDLRVHFRDNVTARYLSCPTRAFPR